MYAATIFQFKNMLKNLEVCMKKAEGFADSKKFDVNVLANSRLAPDMFNFIKQIQSCCDAAKFCAAYLTQQTPTKHEDNEATWKEAKERLQKVITYLESFKGGDFEKSASLQIKPGWAKGQWMQAEDYVQEIAIPNFYFHVITAYAILRNSGVDVGKMDYLGNVKLQGTANS